MKTILRELYIITLSVILALLIVTATGFLTGGFWAFFKTAFQFGYDLSIH